MSKKKEVKKLPAKAPVTQKAKPDVVPTLDLSKITALGTTDMQQVLGDFEKFRNVLLKDISLPLLTPVSRDLPGTENEPVYDSAAKKDIQGNIFPGFNKDYQQFLFFHIGDIKLAKQFLRWIAPQLSSMSEVLAFRRMYRSAALRLGQKDVNLHTTHVNIAFSNPAIGRLTRPEDALAFGEISFRQGMAQRSPYLGDPTEPGQDGNPRTWLVGGPKNEADIIIIVASDTAAALQTMVNTIKTKSAASKLKLIFEQAGETLPGDLRGHEHFGFKDGISQPGMRGKASVAPGDYLTPRYLQATDPRFMYFAKPGQPLTWPGQYLLGEPRQHPEDIENAAPTPAANFPRWAARGSYLVVRRLKQDVPLFWRFAKEAATALRMDVTQFASKLVGRWPSGAPIMRMRATDNPALGDDPWANNHFIFDDNTRPSQLIPIPGYPGDTFPQATQDFLATVCPHFAHIRKVNPRESVTDMGKPSDELIRMILRRGIPFGPPAIGIKKIPASQLKQERGLMFLSYSSTIEDQFEFLQARWSNSTIQPNLGGHDPIIGQNGRQGSRERVIDFPAPSGTVRIRMPHDFVIPTGGGYFFAPTISAVRDVLGG